MKKQRRGLDRYKSVEKSEVIKKKVIYICTLRWSENIKFYIFTSENIKYTLYFISIFLYFMTLYIINHHWFKHILFKKIHVTIQYIWINR